MKKKLKQTIGRKEKAQFPDLGLTLVAKIDTGAYTGALHCRSAIMFTDNAKDYVKFTFKSGRKNITMQSPLVETKFIKNSSGVGEERFVIRTRIVLFGKEYPIELSLADRSKMDCAVLIGRKFLNGKFIVDVSKINLSQKSKNKSI